MHSIFVAGSRALSRLNPEIRKRLDNIVDQNFSVLVGDANGADKAVQKYLANLQYSSVIVYCMESCRNNLGGWPVRSHTAGRDVKRDRYYYGIKDAVMAKNATCGFMLWDGISKGTLANAINLLGSDKKVVLYLSPKKRFFNLHNFKDLDNALTANGVTDVARFLESMGVRGAASKQLPFEAAGLVVRQ